MRYAMLKVCQRYNDVLVSSLAVESDIIATIQSITPLYYTEFTKKFAGISIILYNYVVHC